VMGGLYVGGVEGTRSWELRVARVGLTRNSLVGKTSDFFKKSDVWE
jgi:hypothetical protein